jgi:hypothetical protein
MTSERRTRLCWFALCVALPLLFWAAWLWQVRFVPRFGRLFDLVGMKLPYLAVPLYEAVPWLEQNRAAVTWTGFAVLGLLAPAVGYVAVYGRPPARYWGRAGVIALCLLTLGFNVVVWVAIGLPMVKLIEGLGR